MKRYVVMASMNIDGVDYSHDQYTGTHYTSDQWDEVMDELWDAKEDPNVTDAYIMTI